MTPLSIHTDTNTHTHRHTHPLKQLHEHKPGPAGTEGHPGTKLHAQLPQFCITFCPIPKIHPKSLSCTDGTILYIDMEWHWLLMLWYTNLHIGISLPLPTSPWATTSILCLTLEAWDKFLSGYVNIVTKVTFDAN